MTTKTYTRRDSATSVLRKMGINSKQYNDFITTSGDNFVLNLGAAEKSLTGDNSSTKPSTKKKVTKKKATSKKKVTKQVGMKSTETISGYCRKLILDGLENKEVFEKLQKKFGADRIGASKSHYPTWYRCQMRREGVLPAAMDSRESAKTPGAIKRFE